MSVRTTPVARGRAATTAATAGAPVPPRLRRMLDSLEAWRERGVHLVPIRHHSPACALALEALLEQVRPAVVLVEGPAEYTALLPVLQDAATVPPVAVLSLGGDAGGATASYYPLAEFSPEWVALRWAGEHGARAAFIDRSAACRDDDGDEPGAGDGDDGAPAAVVRTLQTEQHLAHSAAMDALARRLGCRDHDEVWEQLFEDRATADIRDWRHFFTDTLAWSGMARLDADRQVLDADGTHAREAVMAAALHEHLPGARNAPGAPVVVVTGAFHTPALLDVLDATPEAAWLPDPAPQPDAEAWLIRYDFARLDALRGYGAGMPSPGLWQRAWRARTTDVDARGFATSVVLDVVTALRDLGVPLGTAQTRATVEQVMGMAALRGRSWPGRTDVLDALTSCLVKDDTGFSGNLGAAVASVFAASGLGRIPAGVAAPPLVAEVRARLEALRFDVEDPVEHRVRLDTARRPRHRERRELLARLRFVGSGLARQVGGADPVAGTGTGAFVEQWAYAWTPLVETALVAAAERAPTLDLLVATTLAQRLEGTPDVDDLVRLLAELALMGCREEAGPVCDLLEPALADLSDLGVLAGALHRLADLAEDTARLRLGKAVPRVRAMLRRGVAACARLVGELSGLEDDGAEAAVDSLVAVRDLLTRLDAVPAGAEQAPGAREEDGAETPPDAGAAPESVPDTVPDADPTGRGAVLREVEHLRGDRSAAPVLVGAATGIAASTGTLERARVADAVVAHLGIGADPTRAADFVVGLVRTCPDVLLYDSDVLVAVTGAVTAPDEQDFLAVLPDLRRALTVLRPTETHRLAQRIAALTGTRASRIDVVRHVAPEEAERGHRIEQDLVAGLVRDGLAQWVVR